MKLAASVILYNFDLNIINNIIFMSKIFDKIFVFDNSDSIHDTNQVNWFENTPSIEYLKANNNKGLAYGLNVNCKRALREKYNWIMLLDQDGVVSAEMIEEMKKFIIEKNEKNNLGAVGPIIEDRQRRKPKQKGQKNQDVLITSGMVINLEAFIKVGMFNKKLFLDYVDYDYCLRLKNKGYKVLQNLNAILQHNIYDKTIIIDEYKVDKLSSIRYYYASRNFLYMMKEYKREENFICKEKEVMKWLFSHMVMYDTQRGSKLLAILLGMVDYKMNSYGKCKWKIICLKNERRK